MDTKIVGVVGAESYDLVYYMARIAYHLGQQTAIVDLSTEGVAETISAMPEVHSGMMMDCRGIGMCENLGLCDGCDYVFVYYGRKRPSKTKCEEVYVITDCVQTDVDYLSKIPGECAPFCSVVCRSTGNGDRYKANIQTELAHLMSEKEVRCIKETTGDVSARLSILYDSMPRLNTISSETINFLTDFFAVDFDKKDIQKALKLVTSGK